MYSSEQFFFSANDYESSRVFYVFKRNTNILCIWSLRAAPYPNYYDPDITNRLDYDEPKGEFCFTADKKF